MIHLELKNATIRYKLRADLFACRRKGAALICTSLILLKDKRTGAGLLIFFFMKSEQLIHKGLQPPHNVTVN